MAGYPEKYPFNPDFSKPIARDINMVRYSESAREESGLSERASESEEKQESKENLSEEMKIARFYADRLTGAPKDEKTLTYLAHAKKDLEAMQNTKDIAAFDLLRQVIAQYEPEN